MAVTPWGAILQGIGGIGESVSSIIGAEAAKNRSYRAIDKAGNEITTAYNNASNSYEPYAATGQQAFQTMARGINNGEFTTPTYNAYQPTEAQPGAPGAGQYGTQPNDTFNYQQDPGYQNVLQAGNQNIQNQAAGAGMLFSGATLKALGRYGAGLAANDYQTAFNRYANQRDFNMTQYNNNRTNANQMYELGLGQYNKNREYGQTENQNVYKTQAQQVADKLAQYGTLANVGLQSTDKMSELGTNLGVGLGNLALQRGQIDAATAMNAGQAVGQGFSGLSQIGAGIGGMGGGSSNGANGIQTNFRLTQNPNLAAQYGSYRP